MVTSKIRAMWKQHSHGKNSYGFLPHDQNRIMWNRPKSPTSDIFCREILQTRSFPFLSHSPYKISLKCCTLFLTQVSVHLYFHLSVKISILVSFSQIQGINKKSSFSNLKIFNNQPTIIPNLYFARWFTTILTIHGINLKILKYILFEKNFILTKKISY